MTEQAIFSLRLPLELKEALDRLAAADDRSLNNYVVRALQQHVAEKTKRKGK